MIKYMLTTLTFLIIIGYGFNWRIIKRLRTEHLAKWKELGSPTLFLNNSISIGLGFLKFQWFNQHKQLNDKKLNNLIVCEKIIVVFYILLFILFVAFGVNQDL
jgi:hypothetical protein